MRSEKDGIGLLAKLELYFQEVILLVFLSKIHPTIRIMIQNLQPMHNLYSRNWILTILLNQSFHQDFLYPFQPEIKQKQYLMYN